MQRGFLTNWKSRILQTIENHINMKQLKFFIFFLLSLPLFAQQGGMWVPSLLEGMNESEMQSLGMKISAKDIYNTNNSSLKDAIAHFNNGCTSEVISPEGLLLTNHHCGYGQIQSHSSVENNYLQEGFWAMNREEELTNEGLSVTFIKRIDDVTDAVLAGSDAIADEEARGNLIKENIKKVTAQAQKESWQDARVSTFYEGNQYMLFIVEVFNDIRLVGAPPQSIGKYGSDTDNWTWPRHTGDFSLFRIYADKNNRPAEYSEDNVAYTPGHFLPISLDGVEEDDFTLVFGFPGRTDEYLPAVAIEQIVEKTNPNRIGIRDISLKIMDEYMRNDAEIRIQYASKYASIANYWKKWTGESLGLKKSNAVAIKKDQEKIFMERVKKAGKSAEYGNILSDFDTYYAQQAPYSKGVDYFSEIVRRNIELLSVAHQANQVLHYADSHDEKTFEKVKETYLSRMQNTYKNYSKTVDKDVFIALMNKYKTDLPSELIPEELKNKSSKELADEIYSNSVFTDYNSLKEVFSGKSKKVAKKLKIDPAFQLVNALSKLYTKEALEPYKKIQHKIIGVKRTYMKALVELSPKEDRIFPNANSTLRVTYGKVSGYSPSDAIYYNPVSYLEGVMEKYIPGDYQYDLPEKLIELYEAKDYGQYVDSNGKLPINFIGTNHTTGGNSGSPSIDAHGNLTGLNFDRVWEGTMSDIYYDPSISRNIMVDARYILFLIDKYAGASYLIDEMELVHPKK